LIFKKSEILQTGKPCTHLFEYKTEQNLKENGKLRVEGKSYVVADEDVLHFRFNV